MKKQKENINPNMDWEEKMNIARPLLKKIHTSIDKLEALGFKINFGCNLASCNNKILPGGGIPRTDNSNDNIPNFVFPFIGERPVFKKIRADN